MKPSIVLAIVILGAACSKSASHDGPPNKARLEAAAKMAMDAYPAPFDGTYQKVVADLGPPTHTSDNMYQWDVTDEGACWELFLTKADKGAAATGLSKVESAQCKK